MRCFAYWNEVANLKMFGVDFSYKGNLHFAEAGRGCVEFYLNVYQRYAGRNSTYFRFIRYRRTSRQKLYGYHRLKNPYIILVDEEGIKLERIDNLEIVKKTQEPVLIDRHDSHLKPVEPKNIDEITPAGMLGWSYRAKTTNFGGHPPEFWG